MKTVIVIFLFFMSYWGWIGFAMLGLYKSLPDKWYIAISLFLLATAWGFVVQAFARWYRDKN